MLTAPPPPPPPPSACLAPFPAAPALGGFPVSGASFPRLRDPCLPQTRVSPPSVLPCRPRVLPCFGLWLYRGECSYFLLRRVVICLVISSICSMPLHFYLQGKQVKMGVDTTSPQGNPAGPRSISSLGAEQGRAPSRGRPLGLLPPAPLATPTERACPHVRPQDAPSPRCSANRCVFAENAGYFLGCGARA